MSGRIPGGFTAAASPHWFWPPLRGPARDRFSDIPPNADVRINELAPPGRILSGFAPELFGSPLDEEDVLEARVLVKEGLSYYEWAVRPHRCDVSGNGRG